MIFFKGIGALAIKQEILFIIGYLVKVSHER